MEIHWFTVIAQIVNFFILVWLLKRFLYKPILTAIDERESKITDRLNDAEAKKTEAKEEQEAFRQKNATFDQEKKKRMEKVVSETKEEREKLLEQARKDAAALSQQLATEEREEQHNRQLEMNRKIKEEVFAVSRKALADLASADIEEQLTQVFIKRLKALNEKELNELKTAFEGASDQLLVRTAFALSEKQQKKLKEALDEALHGDVSLKFEEIPALIGGIELSTNKYKLAWSISEYLREFEEAISKKPSVKTPPVEEEENA
jgi:F-type H+-transporting ATPase subunit b